MTGTSDQNKNRRTKGLASIAAIGLGVGVLGLGLMAVLTSDSLGGLPTISVASGSCSEEIPASAPDERTIPWPGRDRVDIQLPSAVTVRYRGGEGDAVILRGAPRDIAFIEVKGGDIRSTCRQNFAGRVEIVLPGRVFRQVSLKGSGEVIMEAVDQDELSVSLAGSGTVSAQGQSTSAAISIAGSGEVQLGDLVIDELKASIAGSGTVDAKPKTAADINIAGSGEVRLLSRPEDLSTSILGSGRVTYLSGS